MATQIEILKDIFESSVQKAAEIRALLREKKIYMIDVMSSPGSGKTTATDRLIGMLKGSYRIAVIEGDIKTTKDAEKLAKHDIPIIQIETALYNSDCHLESTWIKRCLEKFDLDKLNLVIIENIGNLICPAEFELGDDERFVMLSVAEGEDKPAKYPPMFRSAKTCILNKIDLLPYLDYDMNEVMENIRRVNPDMQVFKVSAKTGEGFDELVAYMRKNIDAKIRQP